ncbi:hypothetical protein, partial [Streptomyces sp. Vc17.3-30]|uniref:hypothetical protein n=1 Tax=Streptomyces sp. Vc17.3-30 TaxID=2841672 RepID=UPI002094AEB9
MLPSRAPAPPGRPCGRRAPSGLRRSADGTAPHRFTRAAEELYIRPWLYGRAPGTARRTRPG